MEATDRELRQEILHLPNDITITFNPSLKRQGHNLHRWHKFPEPKYLYNDQHGIIVREGDETVSNDSQFEICQSCKEAYIPNQEQNICPHCGFNLSEAITNQEVENEKFRLLNEKYLYDHYKFMNQLMYYIMTGKMFN